MRRRFVLLLALALTALVFATHSLAIPLLVELKIKDAIGSLEESAPPADDTALLPGSNSGKGQEKLEKKSNEKGKTVEKGGAGGNGKGHDKSNENVDLKSLTLWLSSDGQSWHKAAGDIVSLTSDGVTARFEGSGKKSGGAIDALESFALSSRDITGQDLYVGISTSATSFTGRTVSARLVSWQYVRQEAPSAPTAVPEPGLWPLLGAAGVWGAGIAFARRRKL